MSEQSLYEALIKLTDEIERVRLPEPYMCFHTTNEWQYELSLHPDRFRMENNELLWLGVKVCVIGSKQSQNKFWRMVNKYIANGIIRS